MKRQHKFKMDVIEAMASSIEREITRATSELASAKPEDFANETIRAELMGLMMAVEEAKREAKQMREALKVIPQMLAEAANDNGKSEEKASIGFTAKLKDAA